MSDRASKFILLCEDKMHKRFVFAFLKECGFDKLERLVQTEVASEKVAGGNVNWVLNNFPKQLHACRQKSKLTEKLLIVVIDADDITVEERLNQLLGNLEEQNYQRFGQNEPAIVLIPKRNIETWIKALSGDTVNEEDDYKTNREVKKEILRQAAQTLFRWSRIGAMREETCIPSLERSFPSCRKIK